MDEALHILDRFFIHFTASTSLVLMSFFGLRTLARRLKSQWLPNTWQSLLLMAALGIFAVAPLREFYDVGNGQSGTKAVFDIASWLLGCGTSTWGLYRLKSDG